MNYPTNYHKNLSKQLAWEKNILNNLSNNSMINKKINVEEGYLTDVAKNVLGRGVFNRASGAVQKASDFVQSAANKLSGVSGKITNFSQSLAKPPEAVGKSISWRIPANADEGRAIVQHMYGWGTKPLEADHLGIQKHARDAQWEMDQIKAWSDPTIFGNGSEARGTLRRQRAQEEEMAAEEAKVKGKKRKPKEIKEPTDKEVAKFLDATKKPKERKTEVMRRLLGTAHGLISSRVGRIIQDVYKGQTPHSGIHLNTGFSGFGLDPEHIVSQYQKAWETAEDHRGSMPKPEELFGSHTYHVGKGHEHIISPQFIGTELAKDVAKLNKQQRTAYDQAVSQAMGHIENLNRRREEIRSAHSAGTQMKLVESFNNHHVKIHAGMLVGGFPSTKKPIK